MASLKDALDDALTEKHAKFIYVLCALPLFFSYTLFQKGDINATFYAVAAFSILMLLTFLVTVTNNIYNAKTKVLPGLNIIKSLITTGKTIIAIVPITAVCVFAGIKLTELQIPALIDNIQLIYSVIVWMILGSIILTSLILFSMNEKITNAYNLSNISNYCIDILIAFIFYIPQLVILNALVLGTIAYVFSLFWGLENPVFIYICCITVVINTVISGSYFAQIAYDVIPRDNVI